ncbi:MAG: hypothetical protein DRP64_17595 [Verrucomicrobia bacterium]|nr:MAG: hypothetical protein DRP64_17595 [Verrucomicrobiota bacterium]
MSETVWVCAAGCVYPSGARVTQRAESLAKIIMPNRVVGYDVMVFVGLQRFVHYRQREEIRATLLDKHGVSLSSGEVSELARIFLGYLRVLHEARAKELRSALEYDGGWPLHVDATGEDGRGTLLVALAGWRRWVLGAWKIPTERSDAISPNLRMVARQFGAPCAVMRDLGHAVTKAANELVEELNQEIPVLACHLHFLKDIGKDLLDSEHGKLRDLFRHFKVCPGLRLLARDLGLKLGEEIEEARDGLKAWQDNGEDGHTISGGQDGIATVRAIAQWVLDYKADSTGQDFPFVQPFLDLYDRCVLANMAIARYLRKPPEDRRVYKTLQRLQRILDPVLVDVPFAQVAKRLRSRSALFGELRVSLRLVPKDSYRVQTTLGNPLPQPLDQAMKELRDIQDSVEQFYIFLERRRSNRRLTQDTLGAIDLIMQHIETHHESLWGHDIRLSAEAGGGIRLVDRTNNILESFFHGMKHGERRRSGRKILTQDFEHLPPEAALACNLNRPDYVTILCGSLDRLADAFAELDAKRRKNNLAGLPTVHPTLAQPSKIASASLPSEDRKIIRSENMRRRITSAAKSKAPRTSFRPPHGRRATAK